MSDLALYVTEAIDSHYREADSLWYVGTKGGAHNPIYFAQPGKLSTKYRLVYISATHIKTTAAVYSGTDRTMKQADGVWAIGIDVDYDQQGNMEAQEKRVANALDTLPPSFLCQTPHGFHAYFMLEYIHDMYAYSYTTSKIMDLYGADPQSKVVTQCLSLYEFARSEIVDKYSVYNSTFRFDMKNFPMYTYEGINKKLGGYSGLIESLTAQVNKQNRVETPYKADTDRVLGMYNVAEILRSIGMEVKEYSDKIITTCPYHRDRNPSAFLNVDRDSEWYGLFVCRSSSCGVRKSVRNLIRDYNNGVI